MEIVEKTVVALAYELRGNAIDGDLIEQTTKEEPFVVLFGADNLIEDFEKNLKGKSVSDQFEFSIPSASAYGERDEDDAVRDIARSFFTTKMVRRMSSWCQGSVLTCRMRTGTIARH